MSVYIRGMEMPESCSECRFFVDAWCYAFKADDWRNAYNKQAKGKRLNNCPLVPVPVHGRLIDKDALEADISASVVFSGREGNAEIIGAKKIINRLHVAPTIIPAEEGET